MMGGSFCPTVMGLAKNNRGFGMSQIFVRKGPLDEVMLVVGHELGHVWTIPLKDQHDEEAKAFAFMLAWKDAIVEHDIAGLASSIRIGAPAENGLHNVALACVLDMKERGRDALAMYWDLLKRNLSVKRWVSADV